MTATQRPAAARDALVAERAFLLRSLADLDAEHAAGELTDDRYRELRDGYTVQAATVLRALDRLDEHATLTGADTPPTPRRSRRRIVVLAALVVATAAGGGAVLARSVGNRQPGQTITGNAQSSASDLGTLARAARQQPDDFDTQMAYATALMQAGQAVDALRAFDTAARLDPAAAAPKAYGGWLVFLARLPDEALKRLDAAIAADPAYPAYPDARFFRGMVLLRGRNDPAAALPELRRFLELAPAGPARDQVRQLVDQLAATSTTTAP